MSRISGFICALLLSVSPALAGTEVGAGDKAVPQFATDSVTTSSGQVRGIQFVAGRLQKQRLPLLAGISVSGDVAGAVMAVVSPFGQYEAACRFNLRGTFFPIVEAGWGLSDHTDDTTDLHYKTGAPYFRIGCDYNFANDKRSGNRILGGLRYGFSAFDYDVDGPDIIDPIWGTATPFSVSGLSGAAQWMEAVFGLEAKVAGIVHLGWSLRYRVRLYNKTSAVGSPWYVPGYGRNGGHTVSGTFNIIFDLSHK